MNVEVQLLRKKDISIVNEQDSDFETYIGDTDTIYMMGEVVDSE